MEPNEGSQSQEKTQQLNRPSIVRIARQIDLQLVELLSHGERSEESATGKTVG